MENVENEEESSEESKDSTEEEETVAREETAAAPLERRLPRVNCQELIVFVVDLCKEEEMTPFQLSEGSSYSPLYLMKRALALFLHNKRAMNPKHKFALVVQHENPIWLVDFTSNPWDIINELENIKEAQPASQCDLSQLFDLLKDQITLPSEATNISIAPPLYSVRTILLYGRSHCLPQFLTGKESFDLLTKSPYFFLDILYTHETPSETNKCEGIFDLLCDLDRSGWSYIFEVSRNATKFHNFCSRLLAHPLQRPAQKDAHYVLGGKSLN